MVYFGNAVMLGATGGALSVKHERVAEIIRDLDPNLELAYIPEDQRSAFDKHPFAVIHTYRGQRHVVMTMPENEVDERVIAKLIRRNTHANDVLADLDAQAAARELMAAKAAMEEMEEKREFAKSVLRSNKSVYRHNGLEFR